MNTNKEVKNLSAYLYAALAVLFQPFFRVALGRTIWNAVDVLIAIILFYFIVEGFKKK